MAGNSKKPAKDSATKVTRITASTGKVGKPAKKPTLVKSEVVSTQAASGEEIAEKRGIATPFIAIGRYFKGAWYELRQVRWPTRKATWSLTGAVIVFTVFIAVLILLLDALFKYLFELMLG